MLSNNANPVECNHGIRLTKDLINIKQTLNSTLTLIINLVDNKSVAISSKFRMVWFRMGETRGLDVTSEVVTVPYELIIFM